VNLANQLTCGRIFLSFALLFFLLSEGLIWKVGALFIFGLASLTDYWDGKIARARGQITGFGKLMDPIADKLLTLSAFIAFTQKGIVSAWMVLLVVARDFLITGVRLSIPPKEDLEAARPSGKNKTVVQFVFILGVLIYSVLREMSFWDSVWDPLVFSVINVSMLGVVGITLWSGVVYLYKNRRMFE